MKYAFLSYIIIVILNFASYYSESQLFDYLIPFLLIVLPLITGNTVRLSFSKEHFFIGLSISLIFILPYFLYEINHGRTFSFPSFSLLIFQLIVVSVPEEIFFRGFLQEKIGNNIKGILITSSMFSFAHFPSFIYYQDIYALLTFFPSLIMGIIYMKTKNIMPCIIFHFLANTIWVGFR